MRTIMTSYLHDYGKQKTVHSPDYKDISFRSATIVCENTCI